jgi:hypothetical protein
MHITAGVPEISVRDGTIDTILAQDKESLEKFMGSVIHFTGFSSFKILKNEYTHFSR